MSEWMSAILTAVVILVSTWAWYRHCFFFWHRWDTHRELSDVCLRCGAIRFK